MADRVIHEQPVTNNYSSLTAKIALIIAIIALIVAWLAYNRAGQDLETKIREEVQQGMRESSDALNDGAEELEQTPTNP